MNNPTIKPQVVSSPFHNFCMSIGAIPTSYKDSLDYYETLLWLIKFLHETVLPALDTNGEAVTELQNLYIELKNYVEHYFDNLDVQEEINNKLDEMVTDGTLQEIIADYLNSKAVFGFDNVESMKEATNLINGSYAKTLGYYDVNDGGSGLYLIRQVTNQDNVDECTLIALNDENLVAELIIENNTINIRQLGAKSLDTDLVKHDIAPYIDIYKNLSLSNESTINLYIPSGIWFTSGNYFKNPNNCMIYGDGTFSYSSELVNGTVISSMNSNQSYLFKFGGAGKQIQGFNIHDLSFSSADFIYDSEINRFKYSTVKPIDTAIIFELANYGTTNNLHFIYIKGESLSIRSSWEVFFGKLYFRYVTNHNGCIMKFKENIGSWTNISACVFDYMMFESFHGDLIGFENHCGIGNCHFNTINIEDREYVENNEEYITITDEMLENWDDDDYIHLSVFKIFEGCRANGNVINNIELNNFPKKIIRWNGNNYIYDTIVNYNNDVTFANVFNNIVTVGMNKNCCLLRTESSYANTNSQTPKFINLLNCSNFDYELKIKGLNSIYVSGNLKSVFSPHGTPNKKDYIYPEYGNWIPCYESKYDYETYKYLWSDDDTINKLNLCVTGSTRDIEMLNYMFTSIVNPNKTIYLRAKIPNGEEAKLYIDNLTDNSGSKVNYLTGTGSYKIYELTPNTTNSNVGDIIGIRFGSNDQGRVLTRDVRLDSYISI